MTKLRVHHPKVFKPLDKPYRYKILYGGRGSGKSWVVARKLLIRAMQSKIRILATRELQRSIKQSVHKLLTLQIEAMGFSSVFTVLQDRIVCTNGSEFIFMGVKHNAEEIKSTEAISICWIEEAESLTENSWTIIDPTVRLEGSEIWATYNTRFKFDYIHQMFVVNRPPPDSLVLKVNYNQNNFFPDVLHKQMEYMKETDYEKYLTVWEGELKQLAEGAIFGNQIRRVHKEERLTFIPIQSNCEVFTFWDIGKNDETAVWFLQRVGREYHLIDYFEGRLQEVEYYTKALRTLGYLYATHYMPHDADHERLGMSRNVRQQFEDGGITPVQIVPRIAHKGTAIELAREIFPNCWFHKAEDGDKAPEQCDGYLKVDDENMLTRAKRMERGYSCLCSYRYKFVDEAGVYQQTPMHDRASNASDAFQTMAQSDFSVSIGDDYADWGTALNG